MITDTIKQEIMEAMKAHDEVKLSTLRMLSSALDYEKIAKQHELSEEEELAIIRLEAKKRKDAIDAYTKADKPERVESEKGELAILEKYLPSQMDDAALEKIVDEVISQTGASSMVDMGRTIGAVVGRVNGQADGSRISGLVKSKLSK